MFFAVMFFANTPLYAAENIQFIDKSKLQGAPIQRLLSTHDFSHIARVDLNNDSIDEYILSNMSSKQRYHFDIIAHADDGLVTLGTITGYKLMISHHENHGVRSLLSFDKADNDFQYDIYKWDALTSQFTNARAIASGGKK